MTRRTLAWAAAVTTAALLTPAGFAAAQSFSDAILVDALLGDDGNLVVDVHGGGEFDALVDQERERIERRAELEDDLETLDEACDERRTELRQALSNAELPSGQLAAREDVAALDDFCEQQRNEIREEHADLVQESRRFQIDDEVSDRLLDITRERIALERASEDVEERCDAQREALQATARDASNERTRERAEDRLEDLERECEREQARIESRTEFLATEEELLQGNRFEAFLLVDALDDVRRERGQLMDQLFAVEDDIESTQERCEEREARIEARVAATDDARREARLQDSLLVLEDRCQTRITQLEERRDAIQERLDAFSGSSDDLRQTLRQERLR